MSGPRARRYLAVVLTALAAVALAAAAIALAGTKTSSETVALHTKRTATAKCPKGKNPAPAGFEATLSNLGPFVHPSALVIDGRAARVSGVNEQGPGIVDGPGKITAIAYCASRAYSGKAGAYDFVAPGARKSVVAKCPAGYSLAAGGFRAEIAPNGNGAAVYVDGLERVSARKWRVSGMNDGSALGKLEALAYCTAGAQQVSSVQKSVQVPSGESRQATATCPSGKSLLLGGVRSQHYGSGYGQLQLGAMKRSGSRGWRVRALKFQAVIGKLTAIAYCH